MSCLVINVTLIHHHSTKDFLYCHKWDNVEEMIFNSNYITKLFTGGGSSLHNGFKLTVTISANETISKCYACYGVIRVKLRDLKVGTPKTTLGDIFPVRYLSYINLHKLLN